MPGVVVEKPIVDRANDYSLLLITIAGKFHVKIDKEKMVLSSNAIDHLPMKIDND